MALLTPEEIEDFEKKLFQNAAKDSLDVKRVSTPNTFTSHQQILVSSMDRFSLQCPGCKSHVMRTDASNHVCRMPGVLG